ncbi:hypothetical protein OUZ56_033820 [Daphnia magna]|uniref:Uncharacterized protein n=1 Tax=Daphnia magna TaxID=35525 RepID=A0ABR0BB63_9CRUS|nr:hypothetical protein OUZ56_025531 [Daphnia magna]KAK4045818.1 hypothetical protein OUZ56_033820 [Daphnia magna]
METICQEPDDKSEWPDSTPEEGEPSMCERIEAEAKSKTVIMSVASVEPGPLYYKHPILRKKRNQADPTASTDSPSAEGSALEPTVEPPTMEPVEESPATEQMEENEENLL